MASQLTFTGDSLADVLDQVRKAAAQLTTEIRVEHKPVVLSPLAVAAVDETAGLTPAPAPAPTPAAQGPDPEALRVEIRTILTPLMKTDKVAAARALVKKYGTGVSDVPADKLQALLDEAKELAK